MRTLLADGNFKQDHIAMKNNHDDVSLSDGLGYMVSRSPFDRYISEAPSLSASVRCMPAINGFALSYA